MNATGISLAAAIVTLALALTGCAGLADTLPRESHTMAPREQDTTRGGGTDGDASAPSEELAASDGQVTSDTPADPVTIRMTWPDEWLEQPADSLPPGSIAMARTLPDAGVAAATVVTYDAGGAASDMPALLAGRGADPASITTGEPRDVAGEPTERWEALSASGELEMVAYPVPLPSGGTSLVTFVVTAGRLAQIEADIDAVLGSYELG